MKKILAFCIMVSLSLPPASAQTSDLTARLGKTVLLEDVAVSPDGQWVAWVQGTADTEASFVHISSTAPGSRSRPARTETDKDNMDASPAWSPDSTTVAFISTGKERNTSHLWIARADGARAAKATRLNGYAARPKWSHDGRRLAFLLVEGAAGGGPLMAAPAMTGVIDTAIHNQRIAVFDVVSGGFRPVSTPSLHVYDFDWSPDDQTFVVTAAPGPGDNNWWVAQVYLINQSSGSASAIYKPSYQVAIPRWSPDGKSVAFIEGLMSDEGFHGGDLFTISAEGKGLTNRSKGHKGSISSLLWVTGDRIVFTEIVGGESAISELSLGSGRIRSLWKDAERMHADGNFPNFALARDGSFCSAVRSSFEHPPEVWVGPIGEWRPLTSLNQMQAPAWGQVKNLEWTNGGFNIQGWLLPPKEVRPGTLYPLVVDVHGGPSGAVQPFWPAKFSLSAVLASQGYFVFMPNPRGSYGQGEDFTRANIRDFGGGDLSDILAGVDAAIANYPINSNRLGVSGWSYGGYATMWAVTQTQRFRAAVAGAGIANWQSYYGQNLIDQWMIPFFGASVYDDPAVYAKSSPITYVKNVKTPVLILVGEHDAECPAPQSFEFWHALRTLRVPTELVIYAGEGHLFMNPTNRVDADSRRLAWFNKYLGR